MASTRYGTDLLATRCPIKGRSPPAPVGWPRCQRRWVHAPPRPRLPRLPSCRSRGWRAAGLLAGPATRSVALVGCPCWPVGWGHRRPPLYEVPLGVCTQDPDRWTTTPDDEAKTLCRACPRRWLCARDAVESAGAEGLWAGVVIPESGRARAFALGQLRSLAERNGYPVRDHRVSAQSA